MNTSNFFIIQKLNEFSIQFTNYKFEYWQDSSMLYHFIQIIPNDFNKDINFINYQNDFIFDFYQLFPDENLAFIKEKDISLFHDLSLVMRFSFPDEDKPEAILHL